MRNKKLIAILSVLCAITLLIIINSVLFSVQHIEAYCYNEDDKNLNDLVITAGEIKKGRSIFALNEQDVINRVEDNVPDKNVKVINIEKKFPNRVSINYVKISEYLKIESGGKNYYLSNNTKIMRIKDADDDASAEPVITLKIKGKVENSESGTELISSDINDVVKIKAILGALEQLMYRATAIGIFDFIYFSGAHESTKNYIYLHTKTGAYLEMANIENAFEKLDLAWSAYKGNPILKQSEGTYIMSYLQKEKKPSVSYTTDNRYRDGI